MVLVQSWEQFGSSTHMQGISQASNPSSKGSDALSDLQWPMFGMHKIAQMWTLACENTHINTDKHTDIHTYTYTNKTLKNVVTCEPLKYYLKK